MILIIKKTLKKVILKQGDEDGIKGIVPDTQLNDTVQVYMNLQIVRKW